VRDRAIAFGCRSFAEGRRALAHVASAFPSRRESAVSVREVFLDTDDGRIRESGGEVTATATAGGPLVLRWLTGDGRLLHRASLAVLPRAAADLPETPFRQELVAVAGTRPLVAVAEVDATQTILAVEDGRQKTVARVVLERGAAVDGASPNGRKKLPVTLRVLPVRGYQADAERVARALGEQGLRTIEGSRMATALAALGRDLSMPGRAAIDPREAADRAVRRILGSLLGAVRRAEPGVRADPDPEALHAVRVAVRRGRSLLGQLDGVLRPDEARPLAKGLRWLVQSTNALRDLDVYLHHLPDYRAMLPEGKRAELEPVEAYLQRRRKFEGRVLAGLFDGERFRSLLTVWEAVAGGAREDRPRADAAAPDAMRPIRDVAAERIAVVWRRVIEGGRGIDDASSAEALHRLRIRCKKLRYLLEFFSGVLDAGELAKPIKALKQLQDNLGRFNELEFQQHTLRRLSIDMLEENVRSPTSERAIEKLVEALARRQRSERTLFASRFARLDSPPMRRHVARGIGVAEESVG
jgi:CHAD domain-containing protein